MARIDEINIGQVAEFEHVVTTEDLNRFVELTDDDNRLPDRRGVSQGLGTRLA